MTRRDRAGLAAAALLCFAPFLVGTHGNIVPTFYIEWLAFALGLVLIACVAGGREALSLPGVATGLFVFNLVLALQVAAGGIAFPERSAVGMLYVAWAALLVLAGARLRERCGMERVVFALQVALAAAAFVLALSGLMQHYQVDLFGLRIFSATTVGLVGQKNHLANIVSCGLISLVFLAVDRRIGVATAVLGAIPMVIALPLADSRSIWIYAVIGLAGLTLCAGSRRPRVAAIGAAALIALVGAQWFFAAAAGGRVLETVSAGDPVRVALLRYGWEIFAANPLLGAGFGELGWRVFDLAPEVGLGLHGIASSHLHNLAVQLLAETGVFGAASILVPLALWLARFPWKRPSPAEAWIGALVLVQLFHGLVELPQWYAHLLGPFALLLGLGAWPGLAVQWRGWRFAAAAIAAAGAIALGVAWRDYAAMERWDREAKAATAAGRALTAGQFARLVALRDSIFASRAEGVLALLASPAPDPRPTLALARHAMRGHPAPQLAARYAELLDLAGEPGEAARVREALAVIGR